MAGIHLVGLNYFALVQYSENVFDAIVSKRGNDDASSICLCKRRVVLYLAAPNFGNFVSLCCKFLRITEIMIFPIKGIRFLSYP